MDIRQTSPDRSTAGTRVVSRVTEWLGSVGVIVAASLLMVAWIAGLLFVPVPGGLGNEVYQLALNSVTSIVTFLMVFVIQSSQNRDSRAMQAKLVGHPVEQHQDENRQGTVVDGVVVAEQRLLGGFAPG
jgi:low affinity Fe/Cu permease